MIDYICKCGAVNEVELRSKSSANGLCKDTGLYCKKCGRWQKWVTKDEAKAIESRFGKQEEKQAELPDELVINGVTYVKKKD